MIIDDLDWAVHCLKHTNYYRLAAYWLPYESDHSTHTFKDDTYLTDVFRHYRFDRELRLLVWDAIERLEVSVRTQMAYHLSSQYGSHPYLKPDIFGCPVKYANNIGKLKKEFDYSKETFSRHFRDKYTEKLPPIWAAVELMSLGQISNWFANIKHRKDRNAISKKYEIDEKIFSSYLHGLTQLRNICAHHGRLWNRRFVFASPIPKYPETLARSISRDSSKNVYNHLVFLKYMLDIISPDNRWGTRLKDLIDTHDIDTRQMGFPDDWMNLPVWTK